MAMNEAPKVKLHRRTPSAALEPFVRQLMLVEFQGLQMDSHLPGTGIVAAFRVRGECQLDDGSTAPRAAVTGLFDRLRHHEHGPGHAVALATFTPAGAAALIRSPLDELQNTTVAMVDLLGDRDSIEHLGERLHEDPDRDAQLMLVERFLLSRIGSHRPDPLVQAAATWIERAEPGSRIRELVRHIGLSQSALERRSRRSVGTTPRRFASLVRLQRVVRHRSTGASLTSVAHAAGYFDQAHLVHDFKRVTGLAPRAYFARESGPDAPISYKSSEG